MLHRVLPRFLHMPYLAVLYSLSLRSWARDAGGTLTPLQMLAVASGTACTYILDHVNDEGFYSTNKLVAYAQLAFFLPIACGCAYEDTRIFWSFVKFIALAAFYDAPMPVVGWRIKSLFPCSKTLFVPAMHVGWCMSVARLPPHPSFAFMFLYYVFLNVTMDVKDIDDDRRKGVVTLPNLLGADRAVLLVSAGCLVTAIATPYKAAALCSALYGAHVFSFYRSNVAPNATLYYFEVWRCLAYYALQHWL